MAHTFPLWRSVVTLFFQPRIQYVTLDKDSVDRAAGRKFTLIFYLNTIHVSREKPCVISINKLLAWPFVCSYPQNWELLHKTICKSLMITYRLSIRHFHVMLTYGHHYIEFECQINRGMIANELSPKIYAKMWIFMAFCKIQDCFRARNWTISVRQNFQQGVSHLTTTS